MSRNFFAWVNSKSERCYHRHKTSGAAAECGRLHPECWNGSGWDNVKPVEGFVPPGVAHIESVPLKEPTLAWPVPEYCPHCGGTGLAARA